MRANSSLRRSGRYALPTKSGSLLPAAPINVPRRTVSPHLATWRSPECKPERPSVPAPCVPLRYALPGVYSPGAGFQRRGPQPPAFVSFQGGAGGNRNPPAFLFRGAGGTFSFEREYPPWFPHPLVRGASAGNPGPLREQRKRKGHSRTETVHYQKHPCEILRSMV